MLEVKLTKEKPDDRPLAAVIGQKGMGLFLSLGFISPDINSVVYLDSDGKITTTSYSSLEKALNDPAAAHGSMPRKPLYKGDEITIKF